MSLTTAQNFDSWSRFLEFAKTRCSVSAFENWLAPIEVSSVDTNEICLRVPNIFVKEYLLDNYKADLCAFVPAKAPGEPSLIFEIAPPQVPAKIKVTQQKAAQEIETTANNLSLQPQVEQGFCPQAKLNKSYRFEAFVEGTANKFVKSAALGVANHPGKGYNPLFIHGNVGLGKTHLLHGIGHYAKEQHKKLRIYCTTIEAFINDVVYGLQTKSISKLKSFYRSLDILLIDDIQFLQNRASFEEEFCNTFESLINQNKQIVITCDKHPSELKLSERLVGRLEWGLVAQIDLPDIETRVAILQKKAEQKGYPISAQVAFFIAEQLIGNVRQLEGAINKLCAHARILNSPITQDLVYHVLKDLTPNKIPIISSAGLSIETVLQAVASNFEVEVTEMLSSGRKKQIVLPRQVAMYFAKYFLDQKKIGGTLHELGAAIGKRSHSTLIHGYKAIRLQIDQDPIFRKKIDLLEKQLLNM